jgi:hypothetical protein
MVSQWSFNGVAVVLQWQWCYSGDSRLTVVLKWCCGGVTGILQWWYNGVAVMLQWCHSGVKVVLQWCTVLFCIHGEFVAC